MRKEIGKFSAGPGGVKITRTIHLNGYKMKRAGMQDKHARERLGLIAAQWEWLNYEGNRRYPSYERMAQDEVVQIQTNARVAAIELGRIGAEVIGKRVRNASSANDLIAGILQTVNNRIASSGATEATLVVDLLTKSEALTLRALQRISNLADAAAAFTTIYGDVALHKAVLPERALPKASEVPINPMELTAKKKAGALVSDEHVDEIRDNLDGMTTEELIALADGGDEAVVVPGFVADGEDE